MSTTPARACSASTSFQEFHRDLAQLIEDSREALTEREREVLVDIGSRAFAAEQERVRTTRHWLKLVA
jgi:hypothetical protein